MPGITLGKWAALEGESWKKYLVLRDNSASLDAKKSLEEHQYAVQLKILRDARDEIYEFVKNDEAKGSEKEKRELADLEHQLSSYIEKIEDRHREKSEAGCDAGLVHSLADAVHSCNRMLALPGNEDEVAAFQKASNNLQQFDPTFSKSAEIIGGLVLLTAAALVALWLSGGIAMTLFPQITSYVPTVVASVCKMVVTPVSPINQGVALAVGAAGLGVGLMGDTLFSSGWNFFSNRGGNVLELREKVGEAKDGLKKLSL